MRTCVGCRSRAEKSAMLRVVADESGAEPVLVPDPGGRLPGRGAYLHLDPGCLDIATRRRSFSRALRLSRPVGVSVVQRWLDVVQEPDRGSKG
ncbi:YlxR family protein [Phytoactinopolyspora alkaliphila]|uniref:YlxR family protein n=1 Tax=Phytoactinopolyspora alkaliphila TaxID=1783498 RepID=A0A6N9YU53_9ACTN|nr:YlxR family protein [Phytoactinopolyspora alkaliphila]NED98505.1 YlxR family protein [Phytoactinopolyspora alkaliphila]